MTSNELEQSMEQRILNPNEMPVDLLDPELKKWIKVIRPSRSSLTYERME